MARQKDPPTTATVHVLGLVRPMTKWAVDRKIATDAAPAAPTPRNHRVTASFCLSAQFSISQAATGRAAYPHLRDKSRPAVSVGTCGPVA